MSDLSIHVHLKVPECLAGLYEPRRYKVMHGGRGGGKSHTVAQVLLERGAREGSAVPGAREPVTTVDKEVHDPLTCRCMIRSKIETK